MNSKRKNEHAVPYWRGRVKNGKTHLTSDRMSDGFWAFGNRRNMISCSEDETMEIAAEVARRLRGGEVLLLHGELGAGKTTFVRGLARALGIRRAVRSPTFTLMQIYPIKCQWSNVRCLVHVDAYRLESTADLRGLGIEEYLGKDDTVVVVEWGKKALPLLRPYQPTIMMFTHGALPEERTITYVSI